MKKLFPEVFETYDLLKHPFYQAWNEGKLTKQQLALYSEQYGQFIRLISTGWNAVGEKEIADEEMEHYQLWKNFRKSLSVNESLPAVKEVDNLVRSAGENFRDSVQAVGALYAFEAQQPGTSSSKLDGLRTHYSAWNVSETYFEVHVNDLAEPALLEEKYSSLSTSEKIVAEAACKETCELLWNALSGIMREGVVEE